MLPLRRTKMLNLIDQYRRQPTDENARLLREYFERNPYRVWVLPAELLRVLVAAGMEGLRQSMSFPVSPAAH